MLYLNYIHVLIFDQKIIHVLIIFFVRMEFTYILLEEYISTHFLVLWTSYISTMLTPSISTYFIT